ncbi:MAG TPA: hypothetical protein VME45_00430 [Stellaceae bacterium]|nr:hypothetical protein [Stellaceae bacterium]
MSSSELLDRPAAAADALARAADALAAAFGDPDQIADADLRALLAGAVRLYAAKAENGMRTPLPPDKGGVTIDDTMILATDLLHALNVQLFELSMWQAMTGNTIAPHQRVDVPQSR